MNTVDILGNFNDEIWTAAANVEAITPDRITARARETGRPTFDDRAPIIESNHTQNLDQWSYSFYYCDDYYVMVNELFLRAISNLPVDVAAAVRLEYNMRHKEYCEEVIRSLRGTNIELIDVKDMACMMLYEYMNAYFKMHLNVCTANEFDKLLGF